MRAFRWLRAVSFRRRLEREMQAEMAEHLERSTERLMARGLSREDATHEARREFGNVPSLQDEGRIAWGTGGFDALLADLRYAARHFIRHPLSTLTMVVVLSVGIAINVVLFTLVHSVTDRPPSGVEASDDLVRIRGSQLRDGSRSERAFTLDEVEAYAGLQDHFAAVAAWASQPVTAAAPGVAEFTVTATFVTGEYFRLLGGQAVRGRGLVAGDAAQLAVLSHAAWTRSFGQDSGILGRTITVSDVPFTIVGIAPPRFRGAAWEARNDMQVWLPLASHRRVFPAVTNDAELYFAIGKLQAGATRASADAAAQVIARRIAAQPRGNASDSASRRTRDPSVEVAPLLADNLEPGAEANLRFVTLAVSVLGLLTLLVTCANVGALQTGLALARRREIAIRMSLGAHRARVIRQLVTESLLLSLVAAAAAVAVSVGLMRVLLGIVGAFSFELVFDRTAILFTCGVAVLAGLLFGLSPALHATRAAITGALKDSTGAIVGGRGRLQRGLVVAQIALTQPLAVCVATVILAALAYARQHPAHRDGERIIQLRIASGDAQPITGEAGRVDPALTERQRLEDGRFVEAFREVPGVTHAAMVPGRTAINLQAFTSPGGPSTDPQGTAPFYLLGRAAMPGYLDLIGTPIVLGRDLAAADSADVGTTTVPTVIGVDMARRLWGDANPIGRHVVRAAATADQGPLTLVVVGVYQEEIGAQGHARNPFAVFVPLDPRLGALAASRLIMLRVSASTETLVPVIREVVRTVSPRSAIIELRTLATLQEEERAMLRGAIALFSSGGVVVLLLCALGLYAVVAFAVGQRSGEIAVRMAIGARARQIVRAFATEGLRLTCIGVALGLPLSIVGLHRLLSLAPEVPDVSLPLVVSVVAIGVLTIAALASWIPASRAAEVEPASILRKE